jgi:AcrR family transcriptional regulator
MPRPANPELVDRIVRVTAEVLAEKGIEGVTMRGVAQRVGCSTTVIYHYFASKDGLLHGAVGRGLGWFVQAVQVADRTAAGAERLRTTSRAYIVWGVENPALYRLMFEQRLPRPAEGEELQRRRQGLVFQRELLEAIVADGPEKAKALDVERAANLVFVTLHGITSATISGRLWGPAFPTADAARASCALVDAAVDQWIAAWHLTGDE